MKETGKVTRKQKIKNNQKKARKNYRNENICWCSDGIRFTEIIFPQELIDHII